MRILTDNKSVSKNEEFKIKQRAKGYVNALILC